MQALKHSALVLCTLISLSLSAQWKSTVLIQKPFRKIRFTEDHNGFVWLATDQGLYRFDGYELQAWKNDPSDSTSIREDRLSYITTMRNGRIWIGYEGGGVSWFHPDSVAFHHIDLPGSPGLGIEPSVRHIGEGLGGRVWIGVVGQGFSSTDTSGQNVVNYGPLPWIDQAAPQRSKLMYNSVYGIYEREENEVWLATHNGLYRFDRLTRAFSLLDAPEMSHTAWRDDCYNHMVVSGDSMIYLNAWMSGLQCVDLRNGSRYAEPYRIHVSDSAGTYGDNGDGLFEIRDVKLGYDGKIWLTTVEDGLLRFDVGNRNYLRYPSLFRTESFRDGCFVDSNGNVWVACTGGVELYLSGQPGSSLTGRVRLTSFELTPERDANATFVALSYGQTDEIRYAYRIRGLTDEWVECGHERTLSVRDLPGGAYTLEIRARKGSLDWGEPLRHDFQVVVPFRESLWFRIALALLLSVAVYALYRMRIRAVRRQEQVKSEFNRKLMEEQMKALRAQMNPHFIFNSLNSINRQIIQSDPQSASHYLTKFAKLMRMVLDNSSQKIVELSKELEALKIYLELERVRFDNRFSFRIDVAEGIQQENTFVPPLIIQPFVENAIWHGLMNKETDDGHIEVHVRRENGTTVIVVEDNGVGRQQAESFKSRHRTASRSQGSRITEERLHMISSLAQVETQDLHHTNGSPAGTRVIIRIPN